MIPVLAVISDHDLTVVLIAAGLAFMIAAYGHAAHSRTLIIAGLIALMAISIFFVIWGESQTGTSVPTNLF